MNIPCPYCKSPDQDVEDLGDHPAWLSGTCGECGRDFNFDDKAERYFDERGNLIHE